MSADLLPFDYNGQSVRTVMVAGEPWFVLGRLVAKPQFHYHPETGEVVADPPQIRVTAKGLEALHQKYMQAAS